MKIRRKLNPKEVAGTAIQVYRDFRLDLDRTITDLGSLEEQVTRIVREMLDSRFDVLLRALYRIDVNEAEFRRVLSEAAPDSVASAIARLIIERECQKIITRQKYRQDQ